MDEQFMKQLFAELLESTGEAIGFFAAAVARTGDAGRLAEELRSQLAAAKTVGGHSTAVRIATLALAALDAEVMIQRANTTKQ